MDLTRNVKHTVDGPSVIVNVDYKKDLVRRVQEGRVGEVAQSFVKYYFE